VTGPGIDEHDPIAVDVTRPAPSYELEHASHGVYTVKIELLSSEGPSLRPGASGVAAILDERREGR